MTVWVPKCNTPKRIAPKCIAPKDGSSTNANRGTRLDVNHEREENRTRPNETALKSSKTQKKKKRRSGGRAILLPHHFQLLWSTGQT